MLAVLLPLVTACATGAGLQPSSNGTTPPWQIPADAYGTQRLYRAHYSGPEGEGSFHVTLRLVSPVRYQIVAGDPVGRSLWALDVTAERGVWLDHRNKATCSFEGSFDVSGIALGPFPLLSLPSLLMGRVPAEPSSEAEPERKEKQVEFRDEIGRRWAAEVSADGRVEGWRLWDQEQPTVWFIRRDNWAYLSDRTRGVQVRWRETVHENLKQEPAALQPPAGYREAPCRDLYPPRQAVPVVPPEGAPVDRAAFPL
ncbi:MAG TPA: hypothetical protein VNW71_15900 [Thermoanaerobaculia bacterium]|nr:hypothetical protein [Thermoanaerobaculia bacterium]